MTKKDIENYLASDRSHSVYSASVHFGVEASKVWKVLGEKLLGCLNPETDVQLCYSCLRNGKFDDYDNFDVVKLPGADKPSCDGYIKNLDACQDV